MTARNVIFTIIIALTNPFAGEALSEEVIDVGSRKQLFVDEMLIESRQNVEQVMNRPYQTGEMLIKRDQPWEMPKRANSISIAGYSSVIKEDGRVRVWYNLIETTNPNPMPQIKSLRLLYAESKDGIHFTKPKLGIHEINGSTANNVVMDNYASAGFSVWVDPNAPPEHRYKLQGKTKSAEMRILGLNMYSSPDGYHWSHFGKCELEKTHDCDSVNQVLWNAAIKRYVLYTRYWFRTEPKQYSYRAVRRLESDDLLNWKNHQVIMQADDVDLATYDIPNRMPPLDYHGAVVFPYEGYYFMLAQADWHFMPYPKIEERTSSSVKGQEPQKGYWFYPSTFDIRLCVSREGKEFKHVVGRKPFLGLGPSGRFDSRMIWASTSPIRMGDEIWFYYVGCNSDHYCWIDTDAPEGKKVAAFSRAVLRLDGFVSIDAPYEGGELVTHPIRFQGKTMELNLDASGGSVLVELLDANGNPIKGFTAADATPVWGNSIRSSVAWGDNRDVSSLADKPIKIRFIMRDCKLYAFQFKK